MTKPKIVEQENLRDWAKEIFQKNSFNMIDVSSKKETFRRALASGKIYVGKEVFELIKNKQMPKGDPVTLAEVAAVLGVKKTSELIPLCHPLPIDHTATKIIPIDGEYLSTLMADHNVGVSTAGRYEVKKLDSDYFDEE